MPTPIQILYVACGLMFILLLYFVGVIRFGRNAYRTRHKAHVLFRPKLLSPQWGELDVVETIKVGGKLYPITSQYGNSPLPIEIRLWENTIPLSSEKMFSGEEGGQVWLHMPETDPFVGVYARQANAYKRRDEELTMRNHYLEQRVKQMQSEQDEDIKQMGETIGTLKKSLYTVLPSSSDRRHYGGVAPQE